MLERNTQTSSVQKAGRIETSHCKRQLVNAQGCS